MNKKLVSILLSGTLALGTTVAASVPANAVDLVQVRMERQAGDNMCWAAVTQALIAHRLGGGFNPAFHTQQLIALITDPLIHSTPAGIQQALLGFNLQAEVVYTFDLADRDLVFARMVDLAEQGIPFAYLAQGHWVLVTGFDEANNLFFYQDTRRSIYFNPDPNIAREIDANDLLDGNLYGPGPALKQWAICFLR